MLTLIAHYKVIKGRVIETYALIPFQIAMWNVNYTGYFTDKHIFREPNVTMITERETSTSNLILKLN